LEQIDNWLSGILGDKRSAYKALGLASGRYKLDTSLLNHGMMYQLLIDGKIVSSLIIKIKLEGFEKNENIRLERNQG